MFQLFQVFGELVVVFGIEVYLVKERVMYFGERSGLFLVVQFAMYDKKFFVFGAYSLVEGIDMQINDNFE